jgi:hypothetical protein
MRMFGRTFNRGRKTEKEIARDHGRERAAEGPNRSDGPRLRYADPEREAARVAGVVTKAVLAAELPPEIVTALLTADLDEPSVAPRLAHAKSVLEICKAAGLEERASRFISRRVPIPEVREDLLEEKAAAQPEIITCLGPSAFATDVLR